MTAWLLGLFVVLLFIGLVTLFTAAAFAIRKDFRERFDRVATHLREHAERIVRNLPNSG
jgi:hypothetical protein